MDDAIRFTGRVLYLSEDPDCVRAQLAGRDVTLAAARPLRDSVSTDEITPITVMLTYDERLGKYPYVGYKAGDELPIGEDSVKNGGFEITVAGKRYGKGSSRESSPLAELSAGIRLIVAESFERIYQQNCDNIGVLTTTDFGVLERILAGEAIPKAEFVTGRDKITREVVLAGGLLAYCREADWPRPVPRAGDDGSPRNLAQKIIERHLHPQTDRAEPGSGVFVAADWRFSHDYFTGMAAEIMHREYGDPAPLHDPDTIIAFQDHLVFAEQSHAHVSRGLLPGVANLTRGHTDFAGRYPVRAHHELTEVPGSEGICHAMMLERYALPGQVVAGTDSHTPHSGALGCLAVGIGSTDMAGSWVTGYFRCKVPETLRIELDGELRPGVTAKDVVLHLLHLPYIHSGGAIGCVFEYGGSAVRAMSVDERATLTNMVAELGGFTGICEPDEKVVEFVKERRGADIELEDWMHSDPGAPYREVIRVDAGALTPMLARPGDPGNGVAANAIGEPVKIDIAYGGSCTAGKRADFDNYHEVIRWAVDRGMRVAPETQLFLQFGTMDVRKYCEERGYIDTFEKFGATMIMPGCGSCANCGPGASTRAEQVTISAINRNFPGRSGPGSVWLASPYTVAASAVAGRIATFDELRDAAAGAATR